MWIVEGPSIASVFLFLLVLVFPLVKINFNGLPSYVSIFQCVIELFHQNMKLVSLLILFTSIIAPLFKICMNISYLWNQKKGKSLRNSKVFNWMNHLSSWGMLDVYLLGILIAAVKISENATVVFGIAFWCICTLIVLLILSNNILQKKSNWGRILKSWQKKIFSHSVALLISAMIMMLPANLLPIMVVTNLGDTSAETILGGIIHLAIAGSWHFVHSNFYCKFYWYQF